MENTNIIVDMDQAYDESLEKIFELLEDKKYFRCRDELLKHNEVVTFLPNSALTTGLTS